MDNATDKFIVYCYNYKGALKGIEAFDTLEDCFDFVCEQNKRHSMKVTMNVRDTEKENQSPQLNLF